MIDTDPRLREELARLVPPPDDAGADWNEVSRRLERPDRRRPDRRVRRLSALALAVTAAVGVIAATPVGGAVGRGIGDFSAWLRGDVGSPASGEEQREFAEDSRTWGGFPDTPKLRRLLAHRADGIDYTLYGFRTGDALCLRLTARGSGSAPATSCAPLRDLREAQAPALVLLADHPFGERELVAGALPGEYVPPRATATFGIVADGVRQLELVADDGRHPALIGANSFLFVDAAPAAGTRVREAYVETADGARSAVPFAAAPFGLTDVPATPAAGEPYGPARVEREVRGGAIAWLERREPRGQSPAQASLTAFPPPGADRVRFARVLTPVPQGRARIVVSFVDLEPGGPISPAESRDRLCLGVFVAAHGGMTGCGTGLDELFRRGPVFVRQHGFGGGDQYQTFSGLASDDVARLDLFLATRERVAVPLRDNAFVLEVARTKFPARLVAYDDQGRVIWVETYERDLFGGGGARAVPGEERVALRVAGRDAEAVLRVAPSTDGGRCWRISYSTGAEGGGCPPKSYRGPVLDVALRPAGRDVFVEVEVREEVAAVVVEPANAPAVRLRPVEGFVIHPVSPDAREVFVSVRAVGADGRELATRGVRIER